eukprot:scaffold67766_cov52-Cyclotella_meneghiniana.AAC.7
MSSSSSAENGINIDTMSLDQLNQMKSSQESRLEQLTAQYHQLRAVSARLSSAQTAQSQLTSSTNNNVDIMIPLTESLYAPGQILDSSKLLVELGAGFFVEKNAKDASKVIDRKLQIVNANSENVLAAAEAASRNVETIKMAMEGKIMEIRARSQGRAYKNHMEKIEE